METESRCIECGGAVNTTRTRLTEIWEECRDCGRRSHWRICLVCNEMNGPRRIMCVECGLPFDRQEILYAAQATAFGVVAAGQKSASR